MSYNKVKAIAEEKEIVNLESLKNGKKTVRSLPFKEVPMELKINGQNTTLTITDIVRMLYNEIEQLKKQISKVEADSIERNADTLAKVKIVANRIDKITNFLSQEGSVVGW